ncbi:hypothetical protein B7486_13010 [cyanobacterium TDX16]|nr:hypothetical protein B7486_13010 [cyanobacterium TDX16]
MRQEKIPGRFASNRTAGDGELNVRKHTRNHWIFQARRRARWRCRVNGVRFHMAMRAVLARPDVSHRDKLVFWALLDKASEAGVAWPSVGTIHEMTNLPERRIRESLSKLIETGIITTTKRSGGRTSTVYQVINPADIAGLNPANTAGLDDQPGDIRPPPRRIAPPREADSDTNPALSAADRLTPSQLTEGKGAPPTDESTESRKEAARLFGGGDEDGPDVLSEPADPLEVAFLKICGKGRGPANDSTGWDREKLTRCVKDHGRERSLRAFQEAADAGETIGWALSRAQELTWASTKSASRSNGKVHTSPAANSRLDEIARYGK